MPRFIPPAERERRAAVKAAVALERRAKRISKLRPRCSCTAYLSKTDLKSGLLMCKPCCQTSEFSEHFQGLNAWMHRK